MPASSRVVRTRFATDIVYAGTRPLTRENALMIATLTIGQGQSSPLYAPVPVGDEHHRNDAPGRVHRVRETPPRGGPTGSGRRRAQTVSTAAFRVLT